MVVNKLVKQRMAKFKLPSIKIPRWQVPKIRMPELRIDGLVCKLPIVQGGMGVGISLARLASAVAREGGIGVIAANAIGMGEPDYFTNGKEANKRALRQEIRKARKKTRGVIGVNIMVAVNDFHNMLNVCLEERVDIVFLGAGLPLKGIPVDQLRQRNVKIAPIVSSARAARLIFTYWQKHYSAVPDAVVVEGPMAGGHLGFKQEQIDDPDYILEKIIPQVVEEIYTFEKHFKKEIPVIAAGGIFSGDDIYKFLRLGASGVQMGSRFVATRECDADIRFKESYIGSRKEDIVLIKSPVGLPGRAIKNRFLEEVDSGVKKFFRCPWRCLESCDARNAKYCISEALNNARQGKLDEGFAFAGTNAYRIDRIVPVKELIQELKSEYVMVIEKWTVSLRDEYERALKKLKLLRKQYAVAFERGIRSLKDEYKKVALKGSVAFREEVEHTMALANRLKAEYIDYIEKVIDLKEQLFRVVVPAVSINTPGRGF